MSIVRIALANIRPAATPDESIALVRDAITSTSAAGAAIVCFPEAYVPGYRTPGRPVPPPNAAFKTTVRAAWVQTPVPITLALQGAVPNSIFVMS